MHQGTASLLFAVLRSVMCGCTLTQAEKDTFTDEMAESLFSLSKKHDLAHLIGLGLQQNGMIGKGSACYDSFMQAQALAVYRYENADYAFKELCAAFEAAQVPFLPLKGTVLRSLYPLAWMRTSCDIDILVRHTDVQRAAQHLRERCGYTIKAKGPHDISLVAPNGQRLELHYSLIEEDRAGQAKAVLDTVWDRVLLREGSSFWYEMTDEMFYFYHISHMAKHFENGGCGIRPFIDLWMLDRLPGMDAKKREALLEQGGLLRFAGAVCRLSRVWLEGEDKDTVTAKMESFILHGGKYGTAGNRAYVQHQKKGGRYRYILSRIFVPYSRLQFLYPVLQRQRWLMPFMQVRRWFRLLFCGSAGRLAREWNYNRGLSKKNNAKNKQFLRDIGLLP